MEKRRFEYELNFQEILKNPVRLFGWVFPIFIMILLAVGVRYYMNVGTMGVKHQPPVNDSLFAFQDVAIKRGGVIPPVDLKLVKEPTQELIDKGRELYDANCSSCHGAQGNGDGAAGTNLEPAPRNFSDKEGWTNGRKFVDMYKTLEEGIIQNGMAAYEYLKPEDRVAIIHYTRTFDEFPEVTDEEILLELDATYGLSKERVESNQIPVKLAIKKVVKEFDEEFDQTAKSFWENSKSETGAQLISENAHDPVKVLKTFFYSGISSDQSEFIETISLAPNSLGFRSTVLRLSEAEWSALYDYLTRVANLRG